MCFRVQNMVTLRSQSLHSAAGNMQVAVTAVGFTTLLFIILLLAAALALGWGRKPDRSRRGGRGGGAGRSGGGIRPVREQAARPARGGGFQAGGKFGVSHHRDMLTVEVNPAKCARFGFCEHEAPDVFYLESDGRFGYDTLVPVEKMEQVVSAMDVCPRRAIKVKIPKGMDALAPPPVPDLPDDGRRTIIPIFGDQVVPEDDEPFPRRRA
jgi:ferredoxin